MDELDIQLYTDSTQQQAYNYYVLERTSPSTIAHRLKITLACLNRWIKIDDWNTSRKDLLAGAEEMVRRQLAHFVTTRKLPLLAKYYRLQNALTDKVEDYLENVSSADLTPKTLQTLAMTIKTMYDVGANVVSICDGNESDRIQKHLGVQVNIISSLLESKRVERLSLGSSECSSDSGKSIDTSVTIDVPLESIEEVLDEKRS